MYIDNNSNEVINYVSRKLTTVLKLTPCVSTNWTVRQDMTTYSNIIYQQLNYNI